MYLRLGLFFCSLIIISAEAAQTSSSSSSWSTQSASKKTVPVSATGTTNPFLQHNSAYRQHAAYAVAQPPQEYQAASTYGMIQSGSQQPQAYPWGQPQYAYRPYQQPAAYPWDMQAGAYSGVAGGQQYGGQQWGGQQWGAQPWGGIQGGCCEEPPRSCCEEPRSGCCDNSQSVYYG